jgi:hypothetical protein
MLIDTAVKLTKERTGEQAISKSVQRLHNGQIQKFNQLKVLTCHYHLHLLLLTLYSLQLLAIAVAVAVAVALVTVAVAVSAQHYQLQAVNQQRLQQQQNCFQSLRSVAVALTVLYAYT